MDTNKIYQGDSSEVLKTLPDESINCVMTSPPYWALRDYGIDGQLGLESTFDEYINKLCNIFDEVKRVLRKDGTCWVNLSDTYFGSGAGTQKNLPEKRKSKEVYTIPYLSHKNLQGNKNRRVNECSVQAKSLCCIPFRFAIEMINRGWILRNTIIWHKPNCMPSSVKDRFTADFEYLFFFSKSKKYYFETQYEPMKECSIERAKHGKQLTSKDNKGIQSGLTIKTREKVWKRMLENNKGRNKRTVWQICLRPFKEAHFAVYPEELCETPIKAGCPKDGIVLDPFFGAGTTGIAALKQNKRFIGIELNSEYIKIAEKRLRGANEV